MGLTNFILECEKDNEQLRNDINYCKNFNKRLQKENQELKKQLEYLRGREYLNQLRFERDMLQNVVDNGEVSKEDKQFIDMTHRNTELLEQQKEFIEYMNKTIEELECEDVDDEDFDKAEKVNSNTQLYKQAGNSIVVNVLENILKNLINFDKGE